MGKTVAAVVGVVALVAIAVAAPYLATAVLGFTLGSVSASIATAIITAGLSLAVAVGMRALASGAPKAKSATWAPQGTAFVGTFGPKPDYSPLDGCMPAMPGSLLHRLWRFHAQRFVIVELIGDCMAPAVTDRFAVLDRNADIRAGDLFSFLTFDQRRAWPDPQITGVVKRFVGINRRHGVIECACTNPQTTIQTGLSNLRYAHKVCATAATLEDARRSLKSRARTNSCSNTSN